MGGKMSQKKGRNGELEIVRIFQANGIDAQPGQAVSYGATPDVVNIPGVHPEIKRVERLNVPEAMAQAVRDSEKFEDGVPVLFHRRNTGPSTPAFEKSTMPARLRRRRPPLRKSTRRRLPGPLRTASCARRSRSTLTMRPGAAPRRTLPPERFRISSLARPWPTMQGS